MDPTRIYSLRNERKEKDWGSRFAIPSFLGEPASAAPLGELWMGAYSGSPSRLVLAAEEPGLDAAIASDPEAWLGPDVAGRFGNELPFLLKILAAETALSIQAHPSQAQARAGFAREEALGIPRDARHRNYRDPHHKPELIVALTPFTALARFREPAEIGERFASLGLAELGPQIEQLRAVPGRAALRGFFEKLMTLPAAAGQQLLARALKLADGSDEPELVWIAKLHAQHPGDLGALAPLYLNLVTLAPGQALFLDACELHSYLEGLAVEIMANSDNVLRGGLTPSHVDISELLETLSYRCGAAEPVSTQVIDRHETRFKTPAEEFELSLFRVRNQFQSAANGSLEILLCTEGAGRIESAGATAPLALAKGASVVVPASVRGYRIEGSLHWYRARPGARASELLGANRAGGTLADPF